MTVNLTYLIISSPTALLYFEFTQKVLQKLPEKLLVSPCLSLFQEEFYGCKIELAYRETVEQNSGR